MMQKKRLLATAVVAAGVGVVSIAPPAAAHITIDDSVRIMEIHAAHYRCLSGQGCTTYFFPPNLQQTLHSVQEMYTCTAQLVTVYGESAVLVKFAS